MDQGWHILEGEGFQAWICHPFCYSGIYLQLFTWTFHQTGVVELVRNAALQKKKEFSRFGVWTILQLQAESCGNAAAPCSWRKPRNCSPSMSNITSLTRAQDTRTWQGDLLVLVPSRASSFPGLSLSSQPRYFPLELLPYATVGMNHHFPRVPLPNLECIAPSGALPGSLGCQPDDHWDPSWQGNSLLSIVQEIMIRDYTVDILALQNDWLPVFKVFGFFFNGRFSIWSQRSTRL